METGLTQDEIHLLLRDMTDVCLRPPEGEAWSVEPVESALLPRERSSPLGRLCRRLDAMRPWSLPLVAAVVLGPLVAVTLQVALTGPGYTLLALGLSAVVGAWVIMRQGKMAFRSLSECLSCLQTGRSVSQTTAQRAVRMCCGLMLLMPDPLTSLAGALFLLPGLQQAVARWLQRETSPVFALS